jgi:RNA polymerase sigma-70 factor (ECF subfamily)
VTEALSPLAAEFRDVFEAHSDYVMKSLRRLGVRQGDVEDLTHEVFLTILGKWSTFDPARPPRPWLFAFALRIASAYRQSAYIRRERFEEPEGASPATAETRVSEQEESALVYKALDALDDDKRVVFTMFELDERTAADIAEALGVPLNTVFSRLRAARQEFTKAVQRLNREPPRARPPTTEHAHAR